VDAILYKIHPEKYEYQIKVCQDILLNLGEDDPPEIYWIKDHANIPMEMKGQI
jgi:hypothetical protein